MSGPTHWYRAYDLHIRSVVALPFAPLPDSGAFEPDVTVRLGAVPANLPACNGHPIRNNHWQARPGAFLMRVEDFEARRRRSVLLHRTVDPRQPGTPSFRQSELFQELADAVIPGGYGRRWIRCAGLEVVRLDAGHRHRIADPAAYLAAVPFLLQVRLRESFEIPQAIPDLCGQGPAENALALHLAGAVRRELHHRDPGAGKPLLGIVGEEEQPDVAGDFMLVDGGGDEHSTVDGHRIGLVAERAAHVVEMLAHLGFPQIFNPRPVRRAMVPGHPCLLFEQGIQPAVGFRVHGFRSDADPVLPTPAVVRSAMRRIIAGVRPDDQHVAAVQHLGGEDRGIAGPHRIAAASYPSLGGVDLGAAQAGHRPHGTALRLGNADDDVTAVETLKVVGERADRLQDLDTGGLRVPARLELDPRGLDRPAAEKIIDVDGEDGTHAGIVRIVVWAINRPMQGTAAGVIECAMLVLDAWIADSGAPVRMIMQVHDELVFEVAQEAVEDVAPRIRERMYSAADLAVSLVVDIGGRGQLGQSALKVRRLSCKQVWNLVPQCSVVCQSQH